MFFEYINEIIIYFIRLKICDGGKESESEI